MSLLRVLVFACLFVVCVFFCGVFFPPIKFCYLPYVGSVGKFISSSFSCLSIFWLMYPGLDRESGVCEEVIIFSIRPEIVSLEFLLNLYT